MARLLYIWELGDNYGHMSCFAAIAETLVHHGHEVYVALQNLSEARKFFHGTGVHYLQTPLWRGQNKNTGKYIPITYADVIRNYGFTQTDGLATLIQAWQELYTLVKPDVAVFNAPPVSLLAAHGLPFKKAIFGSGYCIPPRTTPLPSLRPWEKIPSSAIEERERQVLNVANQALATLNLPELNSLQDIFQVDESFLCTFPEFDHYPQRANATYYGSTFTIDKGKKPEWPEGNGKKLFAYLRPSSKFFVPFIESLRYTDTRLLVTAPGISNAIIERLSAPNITISTELYHVGEIREQCDAAACHAGHATIAAFLLSGIPLILFPNYLEQFMMARNLLRTGAIVVPKPDIEPIPYKKMADAVLMQPQFREAAQKLAFKHRDFSQEKQTKAIVAKIEVLMGK